ncbi:MAG: hypothetical protein AB9M60_06740 [Leptothrix sp. (in: b-proteobacteria)]
MPSPHQPAPFGAQAAGSGAREQGFSARPADVSASLALSDRRSTSALAQVMGAAHRLARWRIGATLALRPAATASQRQVAETCREAMAQSATLAVRPHLLVSAAALGHDRGLLRDLLMQAKRCDTVLLFDHAAADQADETMACLMDLQEHHHDQLGLSLLASRARSAADARLAIAWGLRVRLEHDWPAFDRPGSVRSMLGSGASGRPTRQGVAERFLDLASQLGAGQGDGPRCPVSLITHEPALAEQALARLAQGGAHGTLELRADQPRQGVLYIARQRGVAVRSQLAWGEGPAAHADPRGRWWGALQNGLDTLLPSA